MDYNCYIHIPFCELKCSYCRFASIWVSQKLKIDFYVKNLISEIKKSPFKKGILNTIYFWGWTPSVLSKKNLEEILETLENKYGFSKNIEISLESTPNNLTLENLEIWKKLWINRISIWLQTLNKKALEEINRGNKGDIELCFENLCLRPVSNISINFDFIIGLPYVKKWELLKNIKYILEKYKFVKHISVYMLEEYYNPDKIIETKYDNIIYPENWGKLWLKDEEYLKEYIEIKKYLINSGFNNYEISNFWKPWFECEHNIWYWKHKETLAFWMWAWWFIDWKRYLNADNFKDYYALKKIFEDKLNKQDIFLEKLMFGLRTFWITKKIYEKLDQEKINYFIEKWYLKKESDKIILSDSGILVMDYILREII